MSKIIRNDALNWLLEDENPEVKYRTIIELLDMPKDKSEVKKAYNSLLNSGTVSLVMDKFKLNKKWEDVTALMALAEFGLTRSDISTDDYIERIIKSMNLKYMKCSKILLLRNLVLLGYYEHEWVKNKYFYLFRTYGKMVHFDVWTKVRKRMTLSCRIWVVTDKQLHIFYLQQSLKKQVLFYHSSSS